MPETLTKLDNLYKTVRASALIVLRVGVQRRHREQKSFVEIKPVLLINMWKFDSSFFSKVV